MRIFFIVLSLSICSITSAQKAYFDKSGKESNEQTAAYYEIRSSSSDTIKTFFYPSNTLRSVFLRQNNNRNGAAVFFHENGNVRARLTYDKGWPTGLVYNFYPNGNPQSIERHEAYPRFSFELVTYWDSLGNEIIRDATGFCRCALRAYENSDVISFGKFVAGKKDSLWTIFNSHGKLAQELYKEDSLIRGVSFDTNGNKYEYTIMEETAMPEGGLQAFYLHLMQNIRYPKEARKKRIEGKVFVEFVIEKDGSASDHRVIKAIGGGCDEEAVLVVRSFSKWIPGKQRGQPVRQRMVLPITFKLG